VEPQYSKVARDKIFTLLYWNFTIPDMIKIAYFSDFNGKKQLTIEILWFWKQLRLVYSTYWVFSANCLFWLKYACGSSRIFLVFFNQKDFSEIVYYSKALFLYELVLKSLYNTEEFIIVEFIIAELFSIMGIGISPGH